MSSNSNLLKVRVTPHFLYKDLVGMNIVLLGYFIMHPNNTGMNIAP